MTIMGEKLNRFIVTDWLLYIINRILAIWEVFYVFHCSLTSFDRSGWRTLSSAILKSIYMYSINLFFYNQCFSSLTPVDMYLLITFPKIRAGKGRFCIWHGRKLFRLQMIKKITKTREQTICSIVFAAGFAYRDYGSDIPSINCLL